MSKSVAKDSKPKNLGGRPKGAKDKTPRKKKWHNPVIPASSAETAPLSVPLASSPSVPTNKPENVIDQAAPMPPASQPGIQSDKKLFGELPKLEFDAKQESQVPPPGGPTGGPEYTGRENAPEPDPEPQMSDEDGRGFCGMIFDQVTTLLAALTGPWWLPRKQGNDVKAGEVPMDERGMVVNAIWNYMKSLGRVFMTPLQTLLCVLGIYVVPRVAVTIMWFRNRNNKKTEQQTDSRFAGGPTPQKNAASDAQSNAKPNPSTDTSASKPASQAQPLATLDDLKEHERTENQ